MSDGDVKKCVFSETQKMQYYQAFFAYFGNVFREQNFKIALFFIAKILLNYRTYPS